MKQLRVLFIVALTTVLAAAAPSLVGRAMQAPAAADAGGPATPFDSLHFRSIGPAAMSGRIADFAVYEANPNIWYVGTAHGGVWKTTNNGTTFEPLWEHRGLMSIGDVTVSQSNPDLLWVGTGESNNRQSTSWGDGVYKSTDGGKTFTHLGLKDSRHINRIVIDPRDNNVVFVAATGPLFAAGGERGIYKTTDGGQTWKAVLKGDEDTGANDLVMDATNNKVLYASMYQRRRTVCCMNGGGPGSGIFKSIDGGETWTKLTSGLPEGSLGRIALDVSRKRGNVLYALIEGPAAGRGAGAGAGAAPAPETAQPPATGAAATPPPAAGAGRGGRGRGNRGAQGGRQGGANAPAGTTATTPAAANEASATAAAQGGGGRGAGVATGVNDTATGLYRSDDAGATWHKVNNENARPMYFSQVRIDPNDPDVVIMGGVKLHLTTDGGRTINTNADPQAHDDAHAIWIDPSNSNHILIGDDGGVSVSYDQAKTWVFFPNLPVGLFYHVSVDMATPYNVCGGMQDNYDWCGPSDVRGAAGIANFNWITLQGGDGFVVLQDPKDPRVIYSETQDGNMVRVDRTTDETMSIRPIPPAGEPAYRWQWDTPMILSPEDPAVLYVAAQKVFRSPDRGLTFTPISGDLTGNENREDIVTMGLKGSDIRISKDDGIVAWPTIVALAESPKKAGVLYAGTDDGHLSVTRDAGKTWTNVYDKMPGAPKGGYISRVAASHFDEGTVYATIDDHRQGNFGTYIYASKDFGQSWTSLNNNLSAFGEVVVKCVTEDPKNADVLYVGAETGLFISIDRGLTWWHPKTNFPDVRLDEITIHPRDNAMVLATHGRALWILDHLEPIQELAAAQMADAKLFTPPPTSMFRRPARDRNYEFWGDQNFFGENSPQAGEISFFVKAKPTSDVQLKITEGGHDVRDITIPAASTNAGINNACWDLRVQPVEAATGAFPGTGRGGRAGGGGRGTEPNPLGFGCTSAGGGGGFGGGGGNAGPYVLPGTYTVALVVNGKTVESKPMRVVDDPETPLTAAQRKQLYDMAMDMHHLQQRTNEASNGLASLNRQLTDLSSSVDSNSAIPADVKASFDGLKKEVTDLTPKLQASAFGRGGGGRGAPDTSVSGKVAQAKNGMMGGMWPTSQTMKAYADAKADAPKVVADANAAFAKASTLSASLAKYNVTLNAPAPVAGATAEARTKKK